MATTRRKSLPLRKPGRVLASRSQLSPEEVRDLSAAERRELERAIKDLEDRTRYLLASSIGERITLYYNIADDTYTWDEPKSATLFKRKAAATKIRALLGSGVQVLECRVDKRGQLLKKSIQAPE
jgi:hypothetical protein